MEKTKETVVNYDDLSVTIQNQIAKSMLSLAEVVGLDSDIINNALHSTPITVQHTDNTYRYGIPADFVVFLHNHNDGTRKKMENHQTVYPSDLVFPLSLEADMVFGGKISEEVSTPVKAGTTAKKEPVYNNLKISFARLRNEGIQFFGPLTKYDEAVHNALLSIWAAGCEYASITTIYRAYTHNPKAMPTADAAQEIMDSIDRMRCTDIVYDTTDAADRLGYDRIRTRANLIYAETREVTNDTDDYVTINGQQVGYYVHFYGFPLYDWASKRNQIARFPQNKLTASINRNKSTSALEVALLRRLSPLLNSGKKPSSKISNIIIYDTLFADAGLLKKPDGTEYTASTLKVKKSRYKTYTKRFLDNWIKNGLIKSYKESKEKNIAKIKIEVFSPE